MYFANPFWLFALIPWAGLLAWMLWGRRRRVAVAFLPMWEGPAMQLPPRRGIKLPPISVMLALTALLAAVFAAAGPVVKRGGLASAQPAVLVVVDHGLTMSADDAGKPRFVAAAAELFNDLQADEPSSLPIAVVDPLSDQQRWTTLRELVDTVSGLATTDFDMRSQTASAARRALSNDNGLVVMLTDQASAGDASPRLVRVAPAEPWSAVEIESLSARPAPSPEVMVQVRNDSRQTVATLTVRSGDRTLSRKVDLPPLGGERNYFFDLPLAESIEGQVGASRAFLLRQGSALRIYPSADVPSAIARMVRIYQHERQQPAEDAANVQTVQVVSNLQGIVGSAPAVVAAPATGGIADRHKIVVTDDSLTRSLEWPALGPSVRFADDPPEGWQAVASADGHTLLAKRELPARQVWIGFDADGFSATPAFVVLWTNVLDWVAGSRQTYLASTVAPAMEGWRRVPMADDPRDLPLASPGIYARGDGSRQAFNAPVPPTPKPPDRDQAGAIYRLSALIDNRPAGRDAGPIALWLALACLLAAAVVWKRA